MKKCITILSLMLSLLLTACGTTSHTSLSSVSDQDITPNSSPAVLQKSMSQPLTEFDSIEIDVLAADIEVIPGEDWSVSYNLSEKEPLQRFGVEDGTLYFKTDFDPKKYFDSLGDWFVTITVPKEAVMTSVNLNTISGNIEAQGFSCDSASCNSTSGTVNVSDIAAKKIDMASISGDIATCDISSELLQANTTSSNLNLSGTFGTLNINTVSGKSTICGNISDNGQISSVSGDISLSTNHPVAIDAHSISTITVNGQSTRGSLTTTDGIPVQFQSVSGKISIQTNSQQNLYV